jgi:hypothetical protein
VEINKLKNKQTYVIFIIEYYILYFIFIRVRLILHGDHNNLKLSHFHIYIKTFYLYYYFKIKFEFFISHIKNIHILPSPHIPHELAGVHMGAWNILLFILL